MGALVLHKDKRTSGDAILDVVGRDQPQMRLRLCFDPTHSLWQVTEVETELFKEPPNPLLEFLSRLVKEENPLWSGTATGAGAVSFEDGQRTGYFTQLDRADAERAAG